MLRDEGSHKQDGIRGSLAPNDRIGDLTMHFAWSNLSYDRLRFSVTVAGVAFSIFLMVFQGSLLMGFVKSSSRMVDSSDGEIWVSAVGIPCFECATPIAGRLKAIAMGEPGVVAVQKIAAGAAIWQKPSGRRQIVYIIGSEPGVGSQFPINYLPHSTSVVEQDAVLVDRSNATLLEADEIGTEGEINNLRARISNIVNDFGSFVGYPYLFTDYSDAIHYLGMTSEEAQFLVIHVSPRYPIDQVRNSLQARLQGVHVWTREGFSHRSQVYWIVQTGAGGALLTAALLGFVVGLLIVSQTIYATTMENLDEFATMKALGAPKHYLQILVLTQGLISGLFGAAIGLGLTFPAVSLSRKSIPWIYLPWWLPLSMIGVSLIMCAMASLGSIRKAVMVEPARVFRA